MTAEIIPIHRRPARAAWRQAIAASACGTIDQHLVRFDEHLRANNRAPLTIARYLETARLFSAHLGPHDLSGVGRAQVEGFIAARLESCAGSTVAGNFVSLQQLFKFLVDELSDEGFKNPMEGMTKPAFEDRRIEVPADAIIDGMILGCQRQRDSEGNRPFEAMRDEVIIRMFCDTGARLSEVTDLTLGDNLGDAIRLWGKSKGGGKVERHVAIGPKTQSALRRYLRARSHHPHAQEPQLFLSRTGKKGLLTPNGVRQMVWRRSLACGTRIHPHQMRHRLAHQWQLEGQNEGNLQEIMGWRSPAMLRRYGKSAASERALHAHRQWLEGRA